MRTAAKTPWRLTGEEVGSLGYNEWFRRFRPKPTRMIEPASATDVACARSLPAVVPISLDKTGAEPWPNNP